MKRDCQCRLRIYKITVEQAVVIASQLPDEASCSIADEALTLIPLICQKLLLKLTSIMWVEHYPKGYLKDEEVYEEVTLIQDKITSKRIKKQKIENLLSVKLIV
ncbi:hypothetical protein [Xenococcus sp. PCC 7305]|uniref:hypothetical protein n=1 Tax=Xenococcus sp. PCC 7305 TaxID=102125 RepID=UPI00130E678E|nr:hypothetical protein [Xenococcus sp. PCC 7305]